MFQRPLKSQNLAPGAFISKTNESLLHVLLHFSRDDGNSDPPSLSQTPLWGTGTRAGLRVLCARLSKPPVRFLPCRRAAQRCGLN